MQPMVLEPIFIYFNLRVCKWTIKSSGNLCLYIPHGATNASDILLLSINNSSYCFKFVSVLHSTTNCLGPLGAYINTCNTLDMLVTFCVHVTISKHSLLRYNGVKPVFAADRLSFFTQFNFFACFGGQLRNRTKRD